jgi:hypothetical protein
MHIVGMEMAIARPMKYSNASHPQSRNSAGNTTQTLRSPGGYAAGAVEAALAGDSACAEAAREVQMVPSVGVGDDAGQ